MKLAYNDFKPDGQSEETKQAEGTEKGSKVKEFCTKFWDTTKSFISVMATAGVITSFGCYRSTSVTGDVQVENETETIDNKDSSIDEFDEERNDIDASDVHEANDVEVEDAQVVEEDAQVVEDVQTDQIDDENNEKDGYEDPEIDEPELEEDGPLPECFNVPTPLDKNVDSLMANTVSESLVFAGPESTSINTDLVRTISMVGYPGLILGVCPSKPNAVAFIAAPGSVHTFERDVSFEAGGSIWRATIPYLPGILCSPLTDDSATLISRNAEKQQVPKNATMNGRQTHAGFQLQEIAPSIVAYKINGIVGSNNTLTVSGANFSPANTASVVTSGALNIDVEVRAGDSSAVHVYTTTLSAGESKEARIYPKTSGDTQMYNVAWDTSAKTWCARCIGNELYDVVIPGNLLCKIADDCGCVGDGFDINIISASLNKILVPPHLYGYYNEANPPVRIGQGVNPLSNPSTDHPFVSVKLEKNRTGGLFDTGERVELWLDVTLELVSKNPNPDGAHERITVSFTVSVVDPDVRNYSSLCSCTPVL